MFDRAGAIATRPVQLAQEDLMEHALRLETEPRLEGADGRRLVSGGGVDGGQAEPDECVSTLLHVVEPFDEGERALVVRPRERQLSPSTLALGPVQEQEPRVRIHGVFGEELLHAAQDRRVVARLEPRQDRPDLLGHGEGVAPLTLGAGTRQVGGEREGEHETRGEGDTEWSVGAARSVHARSARHPHRGPGP